MKFYLYELKIIERLLFNRLNADFDSDIQELICKIQKEIRRMESDA